VTVTAIVGTYEDAFQLFSRFSPSMVLFLGSTIGNLSHAQWDTFWGHVGRSLSIGDYFLLGVDLVKDKATLDAAYNDAGGVTAAFTRNLFARINRELGAEIDLDQVVHVAEYVPERERVEIFARFESAQSVYLRPLDRTVDIPAGTMVMTEVSRKFRLDRLRERMADLGFATRHVFTDDDALFGVVLLQRVDD
jgi:L-histidine N-alpha-methyltransferase